MMTPAASQATSIVDWQAAMSPFSYDSFFMLLVKVFITQALIAVGWTLTGRPFNLINYTSRRLNLQTSPYLYIKVSF